jgi:YVTN family beta-propeller protein
MCTSRFIMKKYNALKRPGTVLLIGVILLISSCEKDLGEQKKPSVFTSTTGVFVINEGSFMAGNGDITFYNKSTKLTTQNLFFSVNNRPPGDLPVYMTIHGNDAWIVVNNSNTIEVVDLDSFKVRKTITGLEMPKHIVFSGGRGYVSQLGSTGIAIIDPVNAIVTGTLEGFKSSDKMVVAGGKLFVANWSSYFINKPNNTVMVFDPATAQFIDSVAVTKEPNSMVVDSEGMLWVLSSGGYMGEEFPSLQRINPQTLQVISRLDFPSKASSPSLLSISADGKTLYYVDYDLFKVGIFDQQLPGSPFIAAAGRSLYGLGVDPETGDLYVADAVDFQQEGIVYRYSATGVEIDNFKAGINPSGIFFNGK